MCIRNLFLDLTLKISGYISCLSILMLIIVMIYKINFIFDDLEKRSGIISSVIEKDGIYNFRLKNDTTLYGKGFYTNNDVISTFIYKQTMTSKNLNNLINLNDTVSFFIRKNTYFEYKLLKKDNIFFPFLISDGIIIKRIPNSGIKQSEILTVNHKSITSSRSDYIFSSQAKIILNMIYFLCIILVIIFIFIWIIKAADKRGERVESRRKQITEKHLQDLSSLEKQLSIYITDDFISIPNVKLQEITDLADLYWITDKDTKKAEKIYQKILTQYPTNINALIMYGEFLFSQSRFAEADNIMEKGSELDANVALLAATDYSSINQKEKAKYWKQKYRNLKRKNK